MLVQFHIQDATVSPTLGIKSEFVAQAYFDDDGTNESGESFQDWARKHCIEHQDEVEQSNGAKLFLFCDETSPEFFVDCGPGESGRRQICKRRMLKSEAA